MSCVDVAGNDVSQNDMEPSKEKDSMSQAVYLIFIRVLNPVFPIKMTDRSAIDLK